LPLTARKRKAVSIQFLFHFNESILTDSGYVNPYIIAEIPYIISEIKLYNKNSISGIELNFN